MIVKFYDGCIVKDETKDYILYKKNISDGIIEEFYKEKPQDKLQKEITNLQEQLNAAQEAIDFLIEMGGDV